MSGNPSTLEAPDAVYVRRNWIARKWVEYAEQAAGYLREYGAVRDPTLYDTRTKARHHARHLRQLLVALGHFKPWELIEHTEKRKPHEYVWSLEYRGGPDGRPANS